MRRMRELIEEYGVVSLTDEQVEWLALLTSEWQVLADLASADLILWVPTKNGRFVSVGLCRSATATTVHVDDPLGLCASLDRIELLREAMAQCVVVERARVQWVGLYSVEISCVPVSKGGECFAVISMDANAAAPSRQSSHQWWTAAAAEALSHMITHGEFPSPDYSPAVGHGAPRVTDGSVLIDREGVVMELSPNANSAMRRLGLEDSLIGRNLKEDLEEIVRSERRVDEAFPVVLMGRAPWQVDVEANNHTVAVRAIPLTHHGQALGALLLTRDVTEARKQQKQLMTKDATIREIHHRVKNNLQTVSALLRIQERRSDSMDVQKALQEAGRRVESIAAVHEALSQTVEETVDFDEVAEYILHMAVRVATAGPDVQIVIDGSFGYLSANRASALATILAELVANSVEHGYEHRGGTIYVSATRSGELLTVTVEDRGVGLGSPSISAGLGTQIIRVMVEGELDGDIKWSTPVEGGTAATIEFSPCTSSLGDL